MLRPFLHFSSREQGSVYNFPSSFALAFPFFDPTIQLFLTWARDPLSSTNDLARISKNPAGVEEACFTISVGTVLLSRAALGSRLHDQFRIRLHDTDRLRGPPSTSSFGSHRPWKNGKVHCFRTMYIVYRFTTLLCVTLHSLYNIKAVVISFIVNVLPSSPTYFIPLTLGFINVY